MLPFHLVAADDRNFGYVGKQITWARSDTPDHPEDLMAISGALTISDAPNDLGEKLMATFRSPDRVIRWLTIPIPSCAEKTPIRLLYSQDFARVEQELATLQRSVSL